MFIVKYIFFFNFSYPVKYFRLLVRCLLVHSGYAYPRLKTTVLVDRLAGGCEIVSHTRRQPFIWKKIPGIIFIELSTPMYRTFQHIYVPVSSFHLSSFSLQFYSFICHVTLWAGNVAIMGRRGMFIGF
jgi:hypothetical protein